MKLLLAITCCLVSLTAGAQSTSQNTQNPPSVINTIRHILQFNALYPQEKAYLHFDNTGYFKGETIWYKAYVSQLTQKGRKPTTLSKVLYVELVNPSGDILEVQKLNIDEKGQANGQFRLDSILGTGFYEVRAYTRYMTNWGVNAMFSRVFPIFDAPAKYGDWSHPTISTTLYKDRNPNARDADSLYLIAAKDGIYTNDTPKLISAHFYPEGGDLVSGLKSRVAFTVIDDNGSAYCGKGDITDEAGNKLCSVETDSTGRGVFEIVPTGEGLSLAMKNHAGKQQTFPLPQVKAEGCSMHLDVVSDEMTMQLMSQGDIVGQNIGYAVIHDGAIIACDTMEAAPLIELSLLRETMPAGVNQITVFTEEGQILAERLFFICPKPDKADSITFTPISKDISPCSVVQLQAHAAPNTTFSFSALDFGSMTSGREGNAKTWMLLSSDVKGYIADIDYYFESDDEQHRKAADLLMMVQGWRRYDWNLMTGKRWFDTVQPIEDQLYLYGQLHEYRKKNPVGNVEVETYLFNTKGQNMRGTTTTDSLGNYILNLPDISGDWSLQIFTKINDKRKTFYVGIDRQFAPSPRFITPDETRVIPKGVANAYAKTNNDPTKDDTKEDMRPLTDRVQVIPQVTVKAKKYWTSSDNIQWYNQSTGRHWASIYYNAPQELDKILDKGEPKPTVFQFLAMRNPLFGRPHPSTLPQLSSIDFIRVKDPNNPQATALTTIDTQQWEGGMAYGGRKIRWIIDNGLGEGTSDASHFNYMDSSTVQRLLSEGKDLFSGNIDFPVDMDELKAIYIVPWSPKEEESYVRIYLYRQHIFTSESQKGLRRTQFQGYNEPQVFQQEDLNVLPPLENLRRTLFWDPNVVTDSQGNAKIEFYNNLTAKEIHLSAESITTDGRILVNQ